VNVIDITAPPLSDLAVTITGPAEPVYAGSGKETFTITVTNKGPEPVQDASLSMTYPRGVSATGVPPCIGGAQPCSIGALPTGAVSTVVATLVTTTAMTGTITVTVTGTSDDPVPANNVASLPLTVTAPRMQLLPPIGEPGFVTLAYGVGFPPGAQVTFGWDPGITAVGGPFTVDADGTFRVPVLVLPRDLLGQRFLAATSGAVLFGPVRAPMLVVPKSSSVSNLVGQDTALLGRD
jgi:hypothetical protein